MKHSEKIKIAIEKVFNKLKSLSDEEFQAELEKQEDGFFSQIFKDLIIREQQKNNMTIVRKGNVAAMNGNELWVNTENDEIVKFVVNDKELRWQLYCKNVKITIEEENK